MLEPVSEFCQREIAVEPYLIAPQLLPRGGKMFIAAPEKHNKSFSLLAMGFNLAGATPLWSVPQFTVSKKYRVAYFDQELGQSRLQSRLKTIRAALPEDELRDSLFFVSPRNRDYRFDKRENILLIEDALKETGAEVALFDPVSKFYPGFDENDTRSMSILVLALDTLIERTGATLVFAHHLSKPSQSARHGAQRMRGSTVLAADLDTYIEFSRVSPAHHKNQILQANFTTRDEPVLPIYLKRTATGLFEFMGHDNPMGARGKKGANTRWHNQQEGSAYDL